MSTKNHKSKYINLKSLSDKEFEAAKKVAELKNVLLVASWPENYIRRNKNEGIKH